MPTPKDVDAFSDISDGSTISLASGGSGGSFHSPRPPTAGNRTAKSGVKGRRSKVVKSSSPYAHKQAKNGRPVSAKPSTHELWMSAMRNGTNTLSTENSPINTWTGPRPAHAKRQSKTGTRNFSDVVDLAGMKNKNHVRSASMSVAEPVVTGGGPALRPAEDYYDEIIELKKIINALKTENGLLATKLHRVEEENMIKDRKIEDYLNPRKQPEDVRRTLTDRRADTSSIVNSLKQKLHATERTVKEKESELSQLKRDLKMTNIEEMQIQTDIYYQEVQRMQLALLEMQQNQTYYPEPDLSQSFGKDRYSMEGPGSPLHEQYQLLTQKYYQLQAENKGLKKDLLTAIENSSKGAKKKRLNIDYADMTRGQLLQAIHELEEKLEVSGDKRKSQARDDDDYDEEPSLDRKGMRRASREVEGKLPLRGNTSQKLAQLQDREEELLEENEKLRKLVEKLKEDRSHYRTVADDLRMDLEKANEELARFSEEPKRRTSSVSRSASVRKKEAVEERRQQDLEVGNASLALDQDKAARTLQKQWRRHRDVQNQHKQEEEEEAVTEIQAALRAHRMRRQRLEKLNEEIEVEDEDSSVVTIQSTFRGHLARRRMQDEEPGDEWSRDHDARSRDSRISLQADDEDGMLRDRPSLQAKKLSSQSSLERRSVGGFLHRKSSLTEDTAVSASAVHEQVGPPESLLPAPAPAPVPAPRNIVKKPTPAPRKARAHVSTVQEEGNSQHKSTEQGTGTALDITSVKRRSHTLSESDSDDGVVIGKIVTSPKKTDGSGKARAGSFSGRVIDDISEESEGDVVVSSYTRTNQAAKAREKEQHNRKTSFGSARTKPNPSVHEFGESDDDDEDDIVMTSTKHYREDHPSFSRSNGAVRPQRESRQVHGVNYSNNVDDDDDDDDDALIMTSSSKPYKAQTLPSSSRALSTSGHSKKITQEIQDSNSDDEDDGVVMFQSRKTTSKKEKRVKDMVTETSKKDKTKTKSKSKSKVKEERASDGEEEGYSFTRNRSMLAKNDGKESKRPSLGRKSPLEAESSQSTRKGSLVDSLFSSSTTASTSRRSSCKLFDYSDDDDDDDDDIVMSSSKKKSTSTKHEDKDEDKVTSLWGSSGRGSSNKRKQSDGVFGSGFKSSSGRWKRDEEDGGGIFSSRSRKDSPLDELF